jgi:voltage-gated potassium channel Kch
MLVLATFRTTAPDRSDDLLARIAELHRLEGVRRLDLGGLDTEAIARFLNLRDGMPLSAAQVPAAMLRDRTGGNPFFLRELWGDLERRGGVAALRSTHKVPASIGDTLRRRLAGLTPQFRAVVETAAILGDTFDLPTLAAAGDVTGSAALAAIDAAIALGLIEAVDGHDGVYAFVHALTREAVIDGMASSRRILLHARAAETLAPYRADATVVPRLAAHYLAAHVLGFHEQALDAAGDAGRLAERSLAYEEAAIWFERAADCPSPTPRRVRRCCSMPPRTTCARATSRAPATSTSACRGCRTPSSASTPRSGCEDASWRPGLASSRAADVLTAAISERGLHDDDPRYVSALSSLGRALVFAGDSPRAGEVGDRAIAAARRLDDEGAVVTALEASLWHGVTPDVAEVQIERAAPNDCSRSVTRSGSTRRTAPTASRCS